MACADVDFVLHHAALASVPRSIEEPLVNNAVNVEGFVNMLTAAKDADVARFVYASSSAVYGDATAQPQHEEHTGRPLSPYAASKAINETYAAAFQMTYGIETVGLRYYNIFGRRQDPDGAYAAVIPRWITNLLRGKPCEIFGDGETTRDFCYVANVIQANLLAATEENADATAHAYNVACSHSITLNALFELIREELSALAPQVASAVPAYLPFRPGDIRYSSAAIGKAQRMLAFSPTFSVRDGLREALSWYVGQSRGSYPYEAMLVE
jgi:UDP-N-acetylglucosamine 4-epimerase